MAKSDKPNPRASRLPAFACALLTALLGTLGGRAESPPPAELRQRLDRLVARLPQGTQVGLAVAEVGSNTIWFEHRADVPLVPASVQKLLVTAAALERFGPSFAYQTRVYARGDELWIVGAGDPGLGDRRIAERHGRAIDHFFDEWAAALRQRGLTSLSKIVLDDSVFDEQVRHPDWPDSQADRWYQAPVGGLNINDNCLDITVAVRGGGVELRLQPEVPLSLIDNGLKAGKQQRPVLKRPAGSDVFQLRGTVARGGTLDPVSVNQPTLFFAHALQRALEQRGVAIRGDVVRRRLSDAELSGATLLATHRTDMADVLWRCNTFSQNLFAECLLKTLAAYEPDGRRNGTSGSFAAGHEVVQATLARLGVDLRGSVPRDGSGLSRQNRASAGHFVQLLVRMQRHPHAELFLGSLARAGEPGSMRRRYDDPVLKGCLRAKTGTLAGVHTLAGYVTRPDNTVLAFACLVNGSCEADWFVQVCRTLVTAGEGRAR